MRIVLHGEGKNCSSLRKLRTKNNRLTAKPSGALPFKVRWTRRTHEARGNLRRLRIESPLAFPSSFEYNHAGFLTTQTAQTVPTPTLRFIPEKQLQDIRGLFPHTSKGLLYLNHAATSPLSRRVIDSMERHLEDRSEGKIETFLDDLPQIQKTRELVARLIHAESADRIALMGNTSDAINTVVAGLPWTAGDHLLMNDMEFPANIWPYLNLRNSGVDLETIACPDGILTPESIEGRIKSTTRLLAISAVQFLTGFRADLEALGSLCRERNVLLVVDGIQAVGAMRIDVQSMKIDALAAGGQKWQMAPLGTGFLYVTEQLQERIHQKHLGWLSVKVPWDFFDYRQPLAESARRYEGGTLNVPGIWGMHAALSTLLEYGIETIEGHILALTQLLTDQLQTVGGIRLISPVLPEQRAGIVTMELPRNVDAQSVFQSVSNRRAQISLREGRLRISPHFYNTPEEMKDIVGILKEALHEVAAASSSTP